MADNSFENSLNSELTTNTLDVGLSNVETDTFQETNHRPENLPEVYSKSHSLVMAFMSGSRRQLDLMALMYSAMRDIHWEENQIPVYEFPADKLSAWLKISSAELSTVLSPVCETLSSKKVGTREYDTRGKAKGFKYTPFFSEIEYKDAVLRIQPNHKLKDKFIADKKGFALVNSITYLDIEGGHTKRLYEILSRFKDVKAGQLYRIPIIELKGMFGLLDESGEVSADKKSFKENKYFMAHCIRGAIKELQNNPHTSKELIFLPGSTGELGFTSHKTGRKISHIEFHVRWLKHNSTKDTLESGEAIDIIKALEFKRYTEGNKGKSLDDGELIQLAEAYRAVGRDKVAEKILKALIKKSKSSKVIEHDNDNELEDVRVKMDKLDKELEDLSNTFGDIGY
jgi:plasmid replication initiation protein